MKEKVVGVAQGDALLDLMDRSQQLYLSKGFTTILEMAVFPDTLETLQQYAAAGRLEVDLIGAVYSSVPVETVAGLYSSTYRNRMRVGGGKLNIDGGTPGRTAYLREPYHTQAPGAAADYRGYSSIAEQSDIDALVASYYEARVPIFIHALGDAAIDQAIGAIRHASTEYPREDIRTQLIHLQVLNPDQIEALRELDVDDDLPEHPQFLFRRLPQ